MNLNGKKIVVSRTDSIGDVMLTLPVCAWIKEQWPDATVIFLGKGYTKAVAEAYDHVDVFEDWGAYINVPKTVKIQQFRALEADVILHVFPDKEIASLAKKARIPMRVGTSHRSYHLLTCSHRPNFSRRKSDLHESQLNFQLLRPLGLKTVPDLDTIIEMTRGFRPEKVALPAPFEPLERMTILHPKSQGSAVEWPVDKYVELAQELAAEGKNVVFTGTEDEGKLFRDALPSDPRIIDSTGALTLPQLITLIGKADNLVACSTGPLHIAGYSGITTIGLFSPRKPIHPGRWKALGPKVHILVNDETCDSCAKGKACTCISDISVEKVKEKLAL